MKESRGLIFVCRLLIQIKHVGSLIVKNTEYKCMDKFKASSHVIHGHIIVISSDLRCL